MEDLAKVMLVCFSSTFSIGRRVLSVFSSRNGACLGLLSVIVPAYRPIAFVYTSMSADDAIFLEASLSNCFLPICLM